MFFVVKIRRIYAAQRPSLLIAPTKTVSIRPRHNKMGAVQRCWHGTDKTLLIGTLKIVLLVDAREVCFCFAKQA